MRPLDAEHNLSGKTTVSSDATLEHAIRSLAHAPDGDIVVAAPSGEPVGVVTFRDLANAMVTMPAEEGDAARAIAAA